MSSLPIDLVIEQVKSVAWFRLRFEVKLSLESPNLNRCFQAHRQSPSLFSFKSVPEVRGLSSTSITQLHRSYAPLRLPPKPVPKALLRVATPHLGRVSHGTQVTFLTCHPHYPGRLEWVPTTVTSPLRFGLPRILDGSASTTLLSRPAQGSHALRPARLLQPKSLHFSPELQ